MVENQEIALRNYNEPKSENNSNYNFKPKYIQKLLKNSLNRVCVFDTETTIDEYQNLTFGSYKIYSHSKLKSEGIFYNPEIVSKTELKILQNYSKSNNIKLLTLQEFIDNVFYPEMYILKTVCICFNSPFDISRLAKSFASARREPNAFTLRLSDKIENPDIIIKYLNKNQAFIYFNTTFFDGIGNTRHKKGKLKIFKGNFLDLKTLAFALTNQSHSLDSAGKLFNAEIRKTISEEHGKITPKYIEYNRNDVEATYSLYLELKKEYKKYNIDTPITKIYSPASIGKGYLREIGINPFIEQNPDFPPEILGYIMASYYGGRSEVWIRKHPTLINVIDFLSMYPTVCTLQKLWKYIIADKIEYKDDTDKVRQFINNITLEDLQNPQIWEQLNCIVKILPNSDILSVRSKYGNKDTYNIGINHLSSSEPIWYILSDVVASKLLTDRTPNILKALRFEPIGAQNDLKSIKMVGNKEFNPNTEDLFKTLIEYRQEIKNKMKNAKNESKRNYYENLQNNIKIISNATSYGIFIEINTTKSKDKVELNIYGLEKFTVEKGVIETFGRMFNPIVSVLITSASRLILAITERILIDNDSYYAFCDTDSMGVEPKMVRPIQEFFQPLNPYNFETDLFKLEPENYNENTDQLEKLYFFGISPKRYVLYNLIDGKPVIRKYSSHGLGSYMNPFNYKLKVHWHKIIWEDILSEVYGLAKKENINFKYEGKFCMAKHSVTSPHLMNNFNKLNKNKPYSKQIKPFNFMIVGTSNKDKVQPIIPYTKYPQQSAPYEEFIDRRSGRLLRGSEYWKSFEWVYFQYKHHLEKKFDGEIGLLERKHIVVDKIIYIGKEANNLEEVQVLGTDKNSVQKYVSNEIKNDNIDNEKYTSLIMNLTPKQTIPFGISKLQLTRLRKKIKEGKPLNLRRKTQKRLECLDLKFSKSLNLKQSQ